MNFKNFVRFFFFGNYFYGLCVVMLSIEASLQQHFPLNSAWYYLLAFCCTVLYYTKAYISVAHSGTTNTRLAWYNRNRKIIVFSQWLLIILAILSGLILCLRSWFPENIGGKEILLAVIFPLTTFLYYGFTNRYFGQYNLRKIGWLKPFLIGFSWAGMVTVYPVLFYDIVHGKEYTITLISFLLFLKNMMFVSVLCIMFDIKDYAEDYNQKIKTFVTRYGLRATIFFIIIPLSILGLGAFVTFGIVRDFSPMKIMLNVLPFLLLILVAYSLHNRRNIFYYLVIIDGLLLVKALCGITAMTFF